MFLCLRTVSRSHRPISNFYSVTQLTATNHSVIRQLSQFRFNDIFNSHYKDKRCLKQFKITLPNCNKYTAIYFQISIRQKSFDFSKYGPKGFGHSDGGKPKFFPNLGSGSNLGFEKKNLGFPVPTVCW